MKHNGVILKKFAVMEDEIARRRALGEVTVARLDQDHFLKHGIERALQICVEVVVDVAPRILSLAGRQPAPTAFEALCGRRLFVRDPEAVATFSSRVAREYEDDMLHAAAHRAA